MIIINDSNETFNRKEYCIICYDLTFHFQHVTLKKRCFHRKLTYEWRILQQNKKEKETFII